MPQSLVPEGEPQGTAAAAARLPDEVARLRDRFRTMKTAWTAEPAHALLDLPGAGLCVPDLVFTHADTGRRVYFEALGYWSREAVWRRVELVEAGLVVSHILSVFRPTPATAGGRRNPRAGVETAS